MIILDREQIRERVDPRRLAPAIEEAYRSASAGEVTLPPVGYLELPDHGGDCHIKYGHRIGDDFFVVKVAAGFPQNDPSIAPQNNGVSLVLSAVSGEVLAILHDEMLMTDVRTAIGGAIASRTLARNDATKLLIVGTGIQAHHQIEAHRSLFEQQLDVAVWGRSSDKAGEVAAAHDDVDVAETLSEACSWADIVVTVTAARDPIVHDAWISAGTHLTAVGADAPGKHELAPELLARADRLVADSMTQCLDHGELSVFETPPPAVELGSILAGDATGRTDDSQITIADLTGIAAQDIAIAHAALTADQP